MTCLSILARQRPRTRPKSAATIRIGRQRYPPHFSRSTHGRRYGRRGGTLVPDPRLARGGYAVSPIELAEKEQESDLDAGRAANTNADPGNPGSALFFNLEVRGASIPNG